MSWYTDYLKEIIKWKHLWLMKTGTHNITWCNAAGHGRTEMKLCRNQESLVGGG